VGGLLAGGRSAAGACTVLLCKRTDGRTDGAMCEWTHIHKLTCIHMYIVRVDTHIDIHIFLYVRTHT
jgi:hypothetical protein